MALTVTDVKKIAHLARLNIPEAEISELTEQLSDIFGFVAQMNQTDTSHIEPLANPLALNQRLRADVVTEVNQREAFQKIAPQTEVGLYLVPKVIEG